MGSALDWNSAKAGPNGEIHVPGKRRIPAELVIHLESGYDAGTCFDYETGVVHSPALTYDDILPTSGVRSGDTSILSELLPGFFQDTLPGLTPEQLWASPLVFAMAQAEGKGIYSAILEQCNYLLSTGFYFQNTDETEMTRQIMTRILIERSSYHYGAALAELSGGDLTSPQVRPWLPGSPELRALCRGIKETPVSSLTTDYFQPAENLASQLQAMIAPMYHHVAFLSQAPEGEDKKDRADPSTTGFMLGFIHQRAVDEMFKRNNWQGQLPGNTTAESARLQINAALQQGELDQLVPSSLNPGNTQLSDLKRMLGAEFCKFLSSESPLFKEISELALAVAPHE